MNATVNNSSHHTHILHTKIGTTCDTLDASDRLPLHARRGRGSVVLIRERISFNVLRLSRSTQADTQPAAQSKRLCSADLPSSFSVSGLGFGLSNEARADALRRLVMRKYHIAQTPVNEALVAREGTRRLGLT